MIHSHSISFDCFIFAISSDQESGIDFYATLALTNQIGHVTILASLIGHHSSVESKSTLEFFIGSVLDSEEPKAGFL